MEWIIAIPIGLVIVGLVLLGTRHQEKCLRKTYEKEQAEYMKKHPNSYGIGEFTLYKY